MSRIDASTADRRRVEELEAQLREARETLGAIRGGEVDAVVVGGPGGEPQVYTLRDADRPYRLLIERMREGAATLGRDGVVLFCNGALAGLLGLPAERLVGQPMRDRVAGTDGDRAAFDALVAAGEGKREMALAAGGRTIPVLLSVTAIPVEEGAEAVVCAVVTDLTDQRRQAGELARAEARLAAEVARAEGEGFARLLLDSATDYAIIATDPEGRATAWNVGAANIFGWASEEALGRSTLRVWTPEDRAAGAPGQEMATALAEGRAEDERWHLRRDGSRFWANGLMMPIRGPDGGHGGFLKILRDQTEARAAEEARLAAAARLDALVATQRAVDAADGDLQAVMDAVARGALAVVPRASGAAVEMRDGDAVVYRAVAGAAAGHLGLRLGIEGSLSGLCLTQGRPLVCADGEADPRVDRDACRRVGARSLLVAPVPHRGAHVAVLALHAPEPGALTEADVPMAQLLVGALAAGLSGVAGLRAEAALRESEKRYRTLFEIIDEGFCVLEFVDGPHGPLSDYVHAEANPAYAANAGIPDIVGRRLREVVDAGEADAWVDAFRRVLVTGEPVRFERELETTGRHLSLAAFRVGPPERRQVAVLFQDVTARKRAEAALRELNADLEARVEARTAERNRIWAMSRDLFAVMGFDGRLKAINPAWTATLGLDEATLLARPFPLHVHPEDLPAALPVLDRLSAGEAVERFEDRLRHADGSWRSIAWTLVPEGPGGEVFYAVGRDVTAERARQAELDHAREALRQSQKMEAMGSLTGGVAHDFNNLLTPIIGALDRLVTRGVGSERERRLVEGALRSAERAKTLVQRLLAFARRQPLQPVAVDVAALVEGMAGLIGSTLGPRIDLSVDLAPDLPPARADANQLEMALLNLAVNARDALPEGGRLTVAATREGVRGEHPAGLGRGDYVRLAVTDTGTGMDEATRARAVEPFFSTKGIGKGTGLGLSMAHGLAAQLGGGLCIDSAPGRGTTVALWLPLSPEAAGGVAEPRPAPPLPAARGRALLVDDEELVRLSTADMLVELGFEVEEAGSAEEALAAIRKGEPFDLLVTDHLMPGMSGAELARAVRALRPGLPILVVSGYAEADGLAPDLPRLVKPFRQAELAERMTAILPSAAPGS